MTTPNIDFDRIRNQLDAWEIEINRQLHDPSPDEFQQEMRRRHGPQIAIWIDELEQKRDTLQVRGGQPQPAPEDQLSPPNLKDPGDAVAVADIYSTIGYLRSQIGVH
ncbi:hypothetical protein [Amantichitinum ursilacus]|uniref:Uncharacterized protein n=1 Tax=Amantichitinum ursilacus TaxID=857265 RepID=A0A0N0XKK9_9NEIS|nr:hypothetical protein [Amantichitinum ursilacus]KPC54777.1 hypothetical protein WG78_04370 [Amantichitinum ursilacus]